MTELTSPTLGAAISISKGKKHEISESPSRTAKRLIGIDDLRNDDLIRYTEDSSGVEVTPDDVLIAWDGANAGTIGYGKSGYIGSTIACLRLKDGVRLFTPFLGLYLKSKFDFLRQTATGATIPHIKRSALESIPLPKIDFNDQIRIAHLLGKVEGLIIQRKQHLQQLDDLLKSVFLEMFGDPVRNERGWDKPALRAFGKISTGNTPPRNDASNYGGQYIEWIKTDNIAAEAVFVTAAAEHLSESGAKRARTVSEGALLVACIAGSVESIGRAALTDRTVAFNQQINAIQPANDVNPLFLYGLFKLSRSYIQNHASKGMKKILTKGDFEQITMIKPPLEAQTKFSQIAERIEFLKTDYRQSLNDLENLYGALSQKAFKGKLDLSRVPLPVGQARKSEPSPLCESIVTPAEVVDLVLQSAPPENRSKLLAGWFNRYLTNSSPDITLGSREFLESAWQALQETRLETEGETPALELTDYDELKSLVFSAVEDGVLIQTFDDERNRVSLQRRPSDWGAF